MEVGRQYRIAFKGLKNGIHPFIFHAGEIFFRSFEYSSIRKGDVTISLNLDKRDSMMVLLFEGKGSIVDACDRCLVQIDVPFEFQHQIVVQFDETERDEEEIIYIDPKRNFLELKEILYELIHVNRPVRNLRDCEAEGRVYCDREALKRLESNGASRSEDQEVWGDLRNLNL